MTTIVDPLPTLLGGLILPAAQWTEVIIPIVVFVIWIINQIASLNKGKPPEPKPQANRPPLLNPRQNRDLQEREQLVREIEEHLSQQRGVPQQAAQQRQAAQPQRPPVRQKPKPPRPPKQTKQPERSAVRKPSTEQSPRRSQIEAGEWDRSQRGGSAAEPASQQFGGNRFDESTGRPSQSPPSVDRVNVTSQAAASAEPTSPIGENPMGSLLALLRDPQSMRNAIILQEILQPPTHRW